MSVLKKFETEDKKWAGLKERLDGKIVGRVRVTSEVGESLIKVMGGEDWNLGWMRGSVTRDGWLSLGWNPGRLDRASWLGGERLKVDGLELGTLPSDLVEFPFRWLRIKLKGKSGEKTLTKYLTKRTIEVSKLGFTVRSGPLGDSFVSSVLGILWMMGSASRVIGGRQFSLERFVGVPLEARRAEDGSVNRISFKQSLRLSSDGDRMGFGMSIRESSTSGDIAVAYPDNETWERQKRVLIAAEIKKLHLDYLLAPKNPWNLLDKAPIGNDPVGEVLRKWRAGDTKLKGEGVKVLRGLGLDVHRISWEEACMLWNTTVTSHLSVEEWEEVMHIREDMMNGKYSLKLSKRETELLQIAEKRTLETRTVALEFLSSRAILGNSQSCN